MISIFFTFTFTGTVNQPLPTKFFASTNYVTKEDNIIICKRSQTYTLYTV